MERTLSANTENASSWSAARIRSARFVPVTSAPSGNRLDGLTRRYAVSEIVQSVANRPRKSRFSSRSRSPSNVRLTMPELAVSAFKIGLRILASPEDASIYVTSRAGFPVACFSYVGTQK